METALRRYPEHIEFYRFNQRVSPDTVIVVECLARVQPGITWDDFGVVTSFE